LGDSLPILPFGQDNSTLFFAFGSTFGKGGFSSIKYNIKIYVRVYKIPDKYAEKNKMRKIKENIFRNYL